MPSSEEFIGPRSSVELRFAAITVVIATLVVYVSLYPFRFHAGGDALQILLRDFHRGPDRFDFLSNVLLYLPLGFFCSRSFPRAPRWLRIALPTLLGTLLSTLMEWVQVYDAYRSAGVWDLAGNALGTLLGAASGVAFSAALFPCAMILCWLGHRMVAHWATPIVSLRPLSLPPVDEVEALAAWLGVALLAEAVWGVARSRWILASLVLAVEVLSAWIAPAIAPWTVTLGGILAVLLWAAIISRLQRRTQLLGLLFIGFIALDALRPFHFVASGRSFGWIPFVSVIGSSREILVSSMFAKVFMYGTLSWMAERAGIPWLRATLAGTVFIFLLRVAEVYLPNRSAETTDAILFVVLACAMKLTLTEDADASASSFRGSHKTVTNAADGEQMAGPRRVAL